MLFMAQSLRIYICTRNSAGCQIKPESYAAKAARNREWNPCGIYIGNMTSCGKNGSFHFVLFLIKYFYILDTYSFPRYERRLSMVQKASSKLTDMLNKAIAREIQVSVQYMWQHVMAKGLESAEIADVFEKVAVAEMKHAEKIAERLFYFDVVPTTKPDPITIVSSIKEMLEADAQAEVEAIDLYKEVIKQAGAESDSTTRLLFEEILADEEDHHDTFTTLLGK
jgi:bacterioferritin